MSTNWPPAARRRLLEELPRAEHRELRTKVGAIKNFAAGFIGIHLRPYQVAAANAIVKSVLARDGNSFVLLFARQSGKDELIANLILYLLARLAEAGASIVCAQPTFRPQTINAMDRLHARASQRPFFTLGGFRRTQGFIYQFLSARVTYLSAEPSASVVGATADRLLIVNEAQDVKPGIYDKRFAPMAASGNATRVFSGTAWTGDTLLDREKRVALQLQKQDGLRRLFVVDAEQVAHSNRLYAKFLKQEIARLGRAHPLVRTQYFCENIDARSRMFTPAHRLLMRGERAAQNAPPISSHIGAEDRTAVPIVNSKSEIVNSTIAGSTPSATALRNAHPFAFLLDVAGQEESSTSYASESSESVFEPHSNPARDAVTLRIVEIDLSTLETLHAPTYRAVQLLQWTGENHLTVFGQIKALAETWRPQHIVIDATGVGEGLWAMLDKAFPTRVIPVKFTQATKSELGYGFLAIINTGRFRDCITDSSQLTTVDRQYAACESEILIGPQKTMRWGVPEGRRDEDGHLIHDDIPVTDSLTAILDRLEWHIRFDTFIIPARDPLEDMDSLYKPSRQRLPAG